MAAPVTVFRGLAAVEGIAGVFDAILYAVKQSGDVTQEFDKEEVKNEHGADISWLARNENAKFSCKLKLVGDTVAHSIIPATTVGSTATVSGLGQPFLAPLSTLVLSGFALGVGAVLNATYQLQPGCKLALVNDKVAELDMNLMRYASTDQQTAIAVIPA